MTPSEIIIQDMRRYGHSDDDIRRMFTIIKTALDKEIGLLLQKNNTVLFVHSLPKHAAELSIYTADSPPAVKTAIKYFIEQLRHGKFEIVYGADGGEQLNQTLKLLKILGIDVKPSNVKGYKWMAKL